MKTPYKAEQEARESREKAAARHSAAEAMMAALVIKYGVQRTTPVDAALMATAAYVYANALTDAREARP